MFYPNLPAVQDDVKVLSGILTNFQERNKFKLGGKTGGFIGRKAAWSPAEVGSEGFKDRFSHRQVVQRCIAAAMALEVPVGFLTESLTETGNFTDEESSALLHNANDELVHYQAFSNAMVGFNVPGKMLDEAFSLCTQLEEFPEHAVKLAGSLELGIFFPTLSMLRKFGNASLKLMVQSVSRDESTHVLTNWHLIDKYLDNSESARFKAFRHEAIEWLTQGLSNPKFGRDYWITQSDKLMANRTAPDLAWTSTAMQLAPFEVSNRQIDAYAAT